MDILKHIYAAAALLLLTGCYTDFEPEIKDQPVLCMNSIIYAGQPLSVSLTHTWLYTDTSKSDATVKDATLKLFVNGEYIETLLYQEYTEEDEYGDEQTVKGYFSTYLPKENDVIRLEAEQATYGEATAEITIPQHVDIERIECTTGGEKIDRFISYWEDETVSKTFDLNMKMIFTDPADVANYYRVTWKTVVPELSAYSDPDGDIYVYRDMRMSGFNSEAEPIFSEFIDALESIMGSDSYGYTLFSDETIAGETYPLLLSFSNVFFRAYSDELPSDPAIYTAGVTVILQSISKSYFDWFLYNWTSSDSFMGSLSDLGLTDNYTAYSNVSTHAGVVIAVASAEYYVDLSAIISKGLI